MIKVGVAGALGRMGSLIVRNVVEDNELELVRAFDIRDEGKDVGELTGIGKTGIKIQDGKEIENYLDDVDVLVDFTVAESAVRNIKASAERGVNLVVGTTGFSDSQWKEIEDSVKGKVAAVVSPNFSVGVNVFWKAVEFLAKYLAGYDVEIIEAHHRFKKDAPSGTALKTAEVIKNVLNDLKIVHGRSGITGERGNEIGMHAIRAGDIVGDHTVLFGSIGERIEITHRAHSRQAFASGAIRAVKFVVDKPPGIYTMNDVLGL